MKNNGRRKKKLYISKEIFDMSVVLRQVFALISDTELIRTLLRICIFDLRTERTRLQEMIEEAKEYALSERVYFSRSRSRIKAGEFEKMTISLLPDDQKVLKDIQSKLIKITQDEKYGVETTTIRFLIFFYGKTVLRSFTREPPARFTQ